MHQQFLPKATTWTMEPIVVFRDPTTGSFRYPGDSKGRSVTAYERKGFERIELRNVLDVRLFETRVGKIEASKMARANEHKQEQRERMLSENRSQLRDQMKSMSRFGREVARCAMDRNNNKARPKSDGVGFHNVAFSFDRSNQQE